MWHLTAKARAGTKQQTFIIPCPIAWNSSYKRKLRPRTTTRILKRRMKYFFTVRLYFNRCSKDSTTCKEQQSRHLTLNLSLNLFFTCCGVIYYSTNARENVIYLFYFFVCGIYIGLLCNIHWLKTILNSINMHNLCTYITRIVISAPIYFLRHQIFGNLFKNYETRGL